MKKRTLSLLLILTLVMTFAVGCGKKDEAPETPEVEAPGETEEKPEETASEGEIVKLGLGKVANVKGNDAGEKPASGQIDVTAAAIGFDADGKIVSVTIDTVQNKAKFDEELNLETDNSELVKTKKELKDDYDMRKASEIEREWFEQMEDFEAWMIGKTAEEVINIPVKERDENHKNVPDVEELTSTVTITVEGYLAAVEDAWNNAVDVEGASKVGLGVSSSIAKSNGLDGDKMPKLQADTTLTALAFDDADKIVGSIIDTVQTKVEFDAEGKVTTDLEAEVLSKKELKDDYGMKKASGIEKEWFEQIEAFEEWMIGKTADEVTGLEVKEVDPNHQNVPDVEELTSSVTITVESFLDAVEKADTNKR